ncbi:MAG TPA: hypothetical protein HPQ03_05935 [Deltaproteobacteria bacterium]|nr:hypothetical protein [Deltaproteobacteria bacterium]
MKSITIHGIDEPLVRLIKSKAESQSLSVNKTIKKLLEESLGVKPKDRGRNRSDFEEFSGQWSSKELTEFEKKVGDIRKIDDGDWQ